MATVTYNVTAETTPEDIQRQFDALFGKKDQPAGQAATPPSPPIERQGPVTPPETAVRQPPPKQFPEMKANFTARADAAVPRPLITLSGKAVAGYNEQVLEAQKLMKAAGIDTGPLDGKEGPRTRAAVEQYAQENGLDPEALTLKDMIAQMERKPENAVSVPLPGHKPELVADAYAVEDLKQDKIVMGYSNSGEVSAPGTQKMGYNPELDRMEILSASGMNPLGGFNAAAALPPLSPPALAPDPNLGFQTVSPLTGMRPGG